MNSQDGVAPHERPHGRRGRASVTTRRRMRRKRVSYNRVRRLTRNALASWTRWQEMLAFGERARQQLEESERFEADLKTRGLSRADFFVAHVVHQDD